MKNTKKQAIEYLEYAINQRATSAVIVQNLAEMFAEIFNKSVSPANIKIPKKFKPAKDNKWEQPVMKDYLMKCCDCGLIHQMDFRIAYGKNRENDRVQLRARRVLKDNEK